MHRAIVAIVAAALVVAACGKSGPPAPEGKYQSKLPGQTLTLNFLDDSNVEVSMDEGHGSSDSHKTSYTMSSDGTVTVKIPAEGRSPDAPEAFVLKRNGEALEMSMQGMTIRFDKS